MDAASPTPGLPASGFGGTLPWTGRLARCPWRPLGGGERRWLGCPHGHQVGTSPAGESVVVVVPVVDGVEDPPRDEVEVPALRVERRTDVDEIGSGDLSVPPGHRVVDEYGRAPRRSVSRVSEPAPVSRPGHPLYPLVVAAGDLLGPSLRQVDDDQLLALVAQRHPVSSGGRRHQVGRAADVTLYHPRRSGGVGAPHHDRLLTLGVAEGDETLTVGEPGGKTLSHRRRRTVTNRGTLPERDGDGRSPGDQRHGVALRVEVDRLQMASGGHEATCSLWAGARGTDLELGRGLLDRVEQPEIGACVVDDPPPVAAREPGVEILVVGVPLQPPAGRGDRVEIPRSLVIREEIDASADPHRVGQVPLEPDERLELAVAVAVHPQRPCGSAAVPLPARRVAAVAANDHAPAAALERDRPRRTHLKQVRLTTIGGDGVDVLIHGEGASPVARNQHPLAVGGPPDHLGVDPEEGQPPRRTSLGCHHVRLGMPLVAAGESHRLSVGRQHRERFGAGVRRQPLGGPTTDLHSPQIVFGYEDDLVAVDGWVAVVAGCHGGCESERARG